MLNVIDLFSGTKPSQAPRADSASDQAAHGMSGRVSKLGRVSCSSWIAKRRFGDALVYGQRQELDALRTIGKLGGLQGDEHRSVSGCHRGQASFWILHSTREAWLDFSRRISIGSGARFSANNRESSASDWHRFPFFQPQKLARTVCNVAETCAQVFVAAIEPSANKRPNTISRSLDLHQKLFRSVRNVGVFSCLK
jgi:hypothetical protein